MAPPWDLTSGQGKVEGGSWKPLEQASPCCQGQSHRGLSEYQQAPPCPYHVPVSGTQVDGDH